MDTIRILIVDDHTVVRDGLVAMMGRVRDFAVVGEASNGLEAVDKSLQLRPDVVLMDLRMPEMSGVDAMRRIGEENPDVKFIVLTTYDTDEYIFDAIEAGAKGYLLKDASRDELFNAIRAVPRGESQIEPGVGAKVLDRLVQLSRQRSEPDPAELLSQREVEVLQLVARGSANKDIAASLSISESTVKTHVCEGRRDNVPPGRSSAEVWRLKTVPPVAFNQERQNLIEGGLDVQGGMYLRVRRACQKGWTSRGHRTGTRRCSSTRYLQGNETDRLVDRSWTHTRA